MNLRGVGGISRRVPVPTLSAPARAISRVLTVAPVAVIILITVATTVKLSREVAANITPVITTELGKYLGHEVRIGRIQYAVPGTITIDTIAVSAGKTFKERGGERAVSGKQAVIRYDWRGMLHDPQHALQYVQEIDLDHPYLLIERYKNNRFNFSDLFKPKTKSKSLFVAKLVVTHGQALFRDENTLGHLRGAMAANLVSNVNATVDFRNASTIVFSGSGTGQPERIAVASVRGYASRNVSGHFRLDLDVRSADLAYWQKYAGAAPTMNVMAGKANASVSLAHESAKTKEFIVHGRADIIGGVVTAKSNKMFRSPVTAVNGQAFFTGTGLTARGTANIAGIPIAASGAVYNFKSPRIAATATSSSIDPVRLSIAVPALKMPVGLTIGRGAAQVVIAGPLLTPLISAQVYMPNAAYAGTRVRDIRGQVVVSGNSVTLPSLSLDIEGGGHIAAHGVAGAKPGQPFQVSGVATGVNLASVVKEGASPGAVSGLADASFLANGTLTNPSLVANVTVHRTRVAQTPLGDVVGRVSYARDAGVHIDRALIHSPSGTATVEGSIVPSKGDAGLRLNVQVAGADLKALAQPYTKTEIEGTGYFRGTVSGTVSAPKIAGDVRLFRPKFTRYSADTLAGNISATPDAVVLTKVALHRYPADARISGSVTALRSNNPILNLDATVSGADVHDLIAQLAVPAESNSKTLLSSRKAQNDVASALPTITGSANGSVHVRGSLKDPSATGQVSIAHATVGAYRVDSANTRIVYAHKSVKLEDIVVRSETATLTGSASWTAPEGPGNPGPSDGKVEAILAGDNVELERFAQYTREYADLHGNVDFSGQLSGTLADPQVSFGIVGRGLTFNGQKLAEFTGFGRYEHGVISSAVTPWEFTLSGPLLGAPAAAGNDAQVKYIVDSFRVVLPNSPESHGVTNVDVVAHIPQDAPERLGHLVETIRQSRLSQTSAGKQILTTLDRLPRPLDATFFTPPDAAPAGTAVAALPANTAPPAADSAPQSALRVSGPVTALTVTGGLEVDGLTVGTNGVKTLKFSGKYAPGPEGSAQVVASGIHLGTAPIDSMVASATIDHDLIHVPTLQLTGPGTLISGTGDADLKGDIKASLDVTGVPLTALNPLMPSARFVGGSIGELSLIASGPTSQPNFTASFDIDHPSLRMGPASAENVALPQDPKAETPSTYALDRIRSGAIRLAWVPGTDIRQLSVSDITAFSKPTPTGESKPVATMTGVVPFRITKSGMTLNDVPDNIPVDAKLTIDDLSVFAIASSAVDPARTHGMLQASLFSTGTAGSRSLQGRITVTNGSLGMQGIDTGLKDLEASARLDRSGVTLENFTAQSTKSGSVAAQGSLAFTGDMPINAKVTMSQFALDEATKQNILARLYNSSVRGKITGALAISGPLAAPAVSTPSGQILVTDASAVLPSRGPDTPSAAVAPSINPSLNISVQLGTERKTVTVGNALLRADAYGDLSLTGTLQDPKVYSRLSIKRGQFILPPSTRLKLVGNSNEVVLRYPRPNPDPTNGPPVILEKRVVIDAETSVFPSQTLLASTQSAVNTGIGQAHTQTQQPTARPQRYTIHVHLAGSLDDPKGQVLELTSDPPDLTKDQMLASLGQQDALMALLSGNGTGNALTSELTQAVNAIGVPMLLDPIETGVAEALGLSAFTVEYTPDTPVLITLTKPLAKKLSVTYTRSFGGTSTTTSNLLTNRQTPLYRIQLDYGLTRKLRIGVSTDNVQGTTLSLNGGVSF